MKKYLEYSEVKEFLKWLETQPKEITKYVEYELNWTHHTKKRPTMVTFYLKGDQLDTFALYLAFIRSSQSKDYYSS